MSHPQFVCVLDFEATCDDNVKYFDNEIIEFPSVLLKYDDKNGYVVVSEFQKFCKPLKKSIITNFCNQLTGITQEQVDNGFNFPDVLNDHHKWLIAETGGDVIILTCGFWDLGTVMISECKKWNIVPPKTYLRFINIKNDFKKFYKHNKGLGMATMLNILNINLEGRHHSGIDDCRNIAKIWQRMISDGFTMTEESVVKIDATLYKIKHPERKKEKHIEQMRTARMKN
ncbi:exonuclease [Tupanvirus soda lake]|uniref:Exonuclease n=2 Tax=Tupanvirus TaxID=2094720 RepID=A0A6N1NW19_9VIRU|nr:exonuclease [Tupanvirus soda lake]QKU35548.1 exonuclease [Tupanvirus soda lake]